MEIIKNKISLCEKTMQRNKSFKLAILTANRYYSLYILTNDEVYLQKAYYVVSKSYSFNPSNVNLFLYKVFFNIAMNNTDSANIMINKFKPYANYYKNNNNRVYAAYLSLLVLLGISLNEKNLQKNIVTLEEYLVHYDDYIYDLLLCYIYIRLNNINKAYTFLENAFVKGSRSNLIYLSLYIIIKKGYRNIKDNIILLYLTWLNANKITNKYVLDTNIDLIKKLIPQNIRLFQAIYINTKVEWVLEEICKSLIHKKDYSINSYMFYKEAEQKQLYINDFTETLINTMFINNIEDISRYSMDMYIRNNKISSEIKPFIYHNLLTKKKLYYLIDTYNIHKDILDFSISSIKQNSNGRYYNSIYRYALEYIKDEDIELSILMENILYNNLFVATLNINNKLIEYVWVKEKEKKEFKVYTVNNNICKIKLCTSNFKMIFLDKEQRSIIEHEVVLNKEIENADIWLYNYLLKKGYEDNDILIAISSYYINNNISNNEVVDILNNTINIKDISQSYRNKISAALGNALYLQDRYDKALEYYNKVDTSYLSDNYIEIMLKVFINTSENEKAINLIKNKYNFISDDTIFTAVKALAINEQYHPVIANNTFNLLVKGWYNPMLLNIVLKYYNGSQRDWVSLNDTLTSMCVNECKLDEIILESTIWMHNFSVSSQNVFIRMYNCTPNHPLINKFVYYTCYEILVNLVLPENNMILALENIYEQKTDKMLAFALSYTYLNNNMYTDKSEKILKDTLIFMENHDILLPIFKLSKNKSLLTPYIEKNESFIYKNAYGKKVYFFYKSEYEKEFIKMPMRYIKFGIHIAIIPVFYNEKINYYFYEELDTGSINTEEQVKVNNLTNIRHYNEDKFFDINNALIYLQMFKFDDVENIITSLLKPAIIIRGSLML